MNTGEAILRDVCENPDDDVPRLVYADWLDEHGQSPRAEAIRRGVRRQPLGAVSRRRRTEAGPSALPAVL